MADHSKAVARARSDIVRLLPIVIVLATGLLQLMLIAILFADWALGIGPYPGGEEGFMAFFLSSVVALAGGAGLVAFALSRMDADALAALRRRVRRVAGDSFPGRLARNAIRWFERHPAPARLHSFRRGQAHLAFAAVSASLCVLFAFAGLFILHHDELAWFFPLSAFLLLLPIALFWLSHAAGERPLPSSLVLWGLAAGVLCAVPAVFFEVYFSRGAWLLASLLGGADATLLDLIDSAVGAALVEEGVKAAAVLLLVLRGKASSRREGFAAGVCVGLGFAFYENMLYDLSGIEAANPILLLRPVNMALHMLGPAIVGAAMGEFRWGGARPALAAGGFAAGIAVHSLWNGIVSAWSYLSSWAITLSGTDQSVIVVIFVHLFVTPFLISGALYVAGLRLAR